MAELLMSETLIDENDKIEFAEKERDYEMNQSFNQNELLEKIEDGLLPKKFAEKVIDKILWS